MGSLAPAAVETAEQTIERLTEERDYWRDEAMRSASAVERDRIRALFGLTPSEAWVLATLWKARGEVVRRDLMEQALPGKHWEEREFGANTICVFVHRIRVKSGSTENVVAVRGEGYRLSVPMTERIDRALAGRSAP